MRIKSEKVSSWLRDTGARAIVFPSSVLVSAAQQQVIEQELLRDAQSWERPTIQNFEGWLQAIWHQVRYVDADVPTLLSTSQEQMVWRHVIEDHHTSLFDVESTAQLAMRTAQVVADWQVPVDGEAWNEHEDAAWFRRWHKDVELVCQREGWMTLGQVRRALPGWIRTGSVDVRRVGFGCWTDLTPALRDIVQSLGQAAELVPTKAAPTESRKAKWQQFETFDEELDAAARWARAALDRDPKQSLAVIVSGLHGNRSLVDRIFASVFYPTAATGSFLGRKGASAFHVAARTPLAEEPVIAAALLIAELFRPRMEIAKACTLLRSPYIAGAVVERNDRGAADLRLRRTRELEVSSREIGWAARDCGGFSKLWADVSDVISHMRAAMHVGEWSELISRLLLAVGWPGEHELSEREQEVLAGWDKALLSMDGLGLVSKPLGFEQAMALLRKQLGSGGLERGDWASPVQILDAGSAEGLWFDAALAMGLGEDRWSSRLFLSPMIPFGLQRVCGIPGSSAETARRWADRAASALVQCAPVVYGSCSGEMASAARSVFATRPTRAGVERWAGKTTQQSLASVRLEWVEDGQAPRYVAAETSRGGTSVLRSQSLCPFKAFAEFRLRAQSPDEACFGFDARDRGSFLHKALELVWRNLGSQERLKQLDHDALDVLVREALTEAVHGDERDSHFYEETMVAERERLRGLIKEWLRIEAGRRQPFQVEVLEQQTEIDLAGLQLRVRTDRVDRLANGKLLLVDYKSGEQSVKKLAVDRPEEPQLLVYATKLGHEVDGLYFGQIKAGCVKAVGMSREQQFAEETGTGRRKLETNGWSGAGWDAQLSAWSNTVRNLASDFVSGVADVNPKSYDTCNFCEVKPFCRIAELQSGGDSEDDDE